MFLVCPTPSDAGSLSTHVLVSHLHGVLHLLLLGQSICSAPIGRTRSWPELALSSFREQLVHDDFGDLAKEVFGVDVLLMRSTLSELRRIHPVWVLLLLLAPIVLVGRVPETKMEQACQQVPP